MPCRRRLRLFTEFLTEYGLFLAKTITVVLAVIAVFAYVATLQARRFRDAQARIRVRNLNKKYAEMEHALRRAMLTRKSYREFLKKWMHSNQAQKRDQEAASVRGRVFVIDFQGDIRASAVVSLREEITAILTVATPGDEVLLRLLSTGGMVHAYGLAASQIARLKDRGIRLTVSVDKVAASGGYMMACVADHLIAAPFAVVGSIGVIAQFPNFNRLLKRHDIDYEQYMAGEHKRTVTIFGDNTEEDRAKFREQLTDIHRLFKDFVKRHRPMLDMEKAATGEYWYGARAIDLKLVDELRTSDDYLLEASKTKDLYHVAYGRRKSPLEKLSTFARRAVSYPYQDVDDLDYPP